MLRMKAIQNMFDRGVEKLGGEHKKNHVLRRAPARGGQGRSTKSERKANIAAISWILKLDSSLNAI